MPQSTLMGWFTKPQSAPTVIDDSNEAKQPQVPIEPPVSDNSSASSPQDQSETPPSDPISHNNLPANVELRACRKEDIKSFKHLNSLLLPIPYGDFFYREILEDYDIGNLTLMALWHDDPANAGKESGLLIGAIRCRLLKCDSLGVATGQDNYEPMLYLSTLVLLSPYRGHGIATQMLKIIIKRAVEDHGISSVGAHVWEANDEGLAWYRKRGFREVGVEAGYYRKLNPQSAVVMEKNVGVMDLLG